MKISYSSFPRKNCMLLFLPQILSVGDPPVLQKQFCKKNIGYMRKSEKLGIVFVVKFNIVNVKYRFLILRFHEKFAYCYFCLEYLQWASPVPQKQFWKKNKR